MVWKVSAGWDFSIRTYNVFTSDSPAAEYARQGDVEGLRQLFQDRQVTPFDREITEGKTLLHVGFLYLTDI